MDKTLSILGIGMRKGDVIIGSKQVIDAIKKHKNLAVFMASDTEQNTRKKIIDKTTSYGIYLNHTHTSEALSNAVGKSHIKVLALKEKDLRVPR